MGRVRRLARPSRNVQVNDPSILGCSGIIVHMSALLALQPRCRRTTSSCRARHGVLAVCNPTTDARLHPSEPQLKNRYQNAMPKRTVQVRKPFASPSGYAPGGLHAQNAPDTRTSSCRVGPHMLDIPGHSGTRAPEEATYVRCFRNTRVAAIPLPRVLHGPLWTLVHISRPLAGKSNICGLFLRRHSAIARARACGRISSNRAPRGAPHRPRPGGRPSPALRPVGHSRRTSDDLALASDAGSCPKTE